MSAVRTVLGDVPPGALGVCDAHDHLFLRTPRLPGQELDDVAAAHAELAAFAAAGGGALVQWTPAGLGRRAAALAALSARTGVHVVAATGLHQAVHHEPAEFRRLVRTLDERLYADLTAGIGDTGVRAGLVKVGVPPGDLDAITRSVLERVAAVQRATGVPVAVHTEADGEPMDVVEALCGRGGVPPDRVVLGHLGRRPGQAGLLAALDAGVWATLDGPSPRHPGSGPALLPLVAAALEAGHRGRLLLGADTTVPAGRAAGGGTGPAWLAGRFRAELCRRLGAAAAEALLVDNPARAFAVP